jgi:hypothetical protein
MTRVETILQAFGKKAVKDLRKSLSDKLQARASKYKSKYPGGSSNPGESALGASIKYTIVDSKINFSLNNYWEAVDGGRKAAGVSQDAKIDKWIKSRNLIPGFQNKNLADRLERQSKNKTNKEKKVLKKMKFADALKAMDYLVRRKLKNKGYQGNEFYSSVMEDGRQEKLIVAIRKAIKKEIEIVVNVNLKVKTYGDNDTE